MVKGCLLLLISAALQVDVWTMEGGKKLLAVRSGKPQGGWGSKSADLRTCSISLQFLESDLLQVRDFSIASASIPGQVNLTATSDTLRLHFFPPQLTILGKAPAVFSVAYDCTDFDEGLHSIEVRLESGDESLSFFYRKVCGRPGFTKFDWAFAASSAWGALLAATAPLVPSAQPTSILHINAKTVGQALVLGLSFYLLLYFYIFSFFALVVLAFYSQIKTALAQCPLFRREILCPFFDQISAGAVFAGLFAVSLAALAVFQLYWAINDAAISLFFFAIIRAVKIDCARCCFLMLFLAFLFDLLQIYSSDLSEAAEFISGSVLSPFRVQLPAHSSIQQKCVETSLLTPLIFSLIFDFCRWRDAKTGTTAYYCFMLLSYLAGLSATLVLFYYTDVEHPQRFFLAPAAMLAAGVLSSLWRDLAFLWVEDRT